jgi:ring-1,2-phenylacetyl-CoA epoxidase subunit PaaC
MSQPPAKPPADPAHVEYVLRLGDNALIQGQRLAQWSGHAPVLEEELALANIALDLVGQARLLLAHAGALEGRGRDEDALAYLRDEAQFRNWTLHELPHGAGGQRDFAVTIVRNLLAAALQVPLWEALAASTDEQLAAIAARAVKEARAHLRHAAGWTVRLGDGTGQSHARMQAALELLWPYTHEFWLDDGVERRACELGVGVATASLRDAWSAGIDEVLAQATLKRPRDGGFVSTGKQGRHSEHMGYLLAEMQSLARQHPGATW